MRPALTFGVMAQRAFALALCVLGLITAGYGWVYGLGHINDIGPGAFPFGLGLLLVVLSGLSFFSVDAETPSARHNVKPLVLIPAGIVAWALLVEVGGLIVANTALVAMMYFSEDDPKILPGIVLATCLTFGGYVVLVLGFGLPFHVLGGWP